MAAKTQRYREAKTQKPIKFIYFDVGGVLLDFSGSLTNLANVLNVSREDIRDFWEPLDDELNRGALTADEFWRQLTTHFHYRGRNIDFMDLWITSFRSIKETHTFVQKISRTRKIGLLTNAMAGSVAKTRALGHIPHAKFSTIIESGVLGITKPDPQIFAIAQLRSGVEAGEILLIDDMALNLRQAHKSGFHTYHFDTDNPTASVGELEKLTHLSP